MGVERLDFGFWDLLSVVFGGLGAGMGIALAFLPESLPGLISVPLIGAIAVLFTVLSLLIQAVSVEDSTDEEPTVEIPASVYNSHLADARESGYHEGRYSGYRKRLLEEKDTPRENHRIGEYRDISKNRKLDEFAENNGEEEKMKKQRDSTDEEEENEEYPPHVKDKISELEKEVEKELDYE